MAASIGITLCIRDEDAIEIDGESQSLEGGSVLTLCDRSKVLLYIM